MVHHSHPPIQISASPRHDEIQRYDSRDAAEVSAYIRENVGLDNALKQYLTIYRLVLDQQQPVADDVDWHPATTPANRRSGSSPAAIANRSTISAPRRHCALEIGLYNRDIVPIATAAPWPSLLMYRWLHGRTHKMVVEHGLRTIIQPPASSGPPVMQAQAISSPNLMAVQSSENFRSYMVAREAEDFAAMLRAKGIIILEILPVSLEEVFLGLTRKKRCHVSVESLASFPHA